MSRLSSQVSPLVPPTEQHPTCGLGRRPTSNSGPMVMDLQRVLAAAYVVQEYKREVPSVKPVAFKKGPVAVTNRLGDQVLSGESETRQEPKCGLYPPATANVSPPVIDFHKISAAAYVGHDYKNGLTAVDTEFLESGRRCARSSDPAYKKVTRLWREYPAGVRSFRTWLATAFVLIGVFGYGYHLNHLARVSTSMAAARVAETRWKSPIVDKQRALFNLDKKTNGQSKASTDAVTTDVQEAVRVIKGTVQGSD